MVAPPALSSPSQRSVPGRRAPSAPEKGGACDAESGGDVHIVYATGARVTPFRILSTCTDV